MILRTTLLAAALIAIASFCLVAEPGVRIAPGKDGVFVYSDNFKTPRFLQDTFTENLGLEQWGGRVFSAGPARNRTLIYRFHGDRVVESAEIRVSQKSNGPNLGGHTYLYVSPNGIDWTDSGSSEEIAADVNGWQTGNLTLKPSAAARLKGKTEVWLKIVMDNNSGLTTSESNTLTGLEVRIKTGGAAGGSANPTADELKWGKLQSKSGWRLILLDSMDPGWLRPRCYFEEADGWLREANPLVHSSSEGFTVRRRDTGDAPRLSMAMFVKTGKPGPVMARLTLLCTKDSSRKVSVTWDGKTVASIDPASYFDTERSFNITLASSAKAGVHQVRLAGQDSGSVTVRRVAVAGDVAWASKPGLPQGGKLGVISAYYMPDPEPPAASQVVEGRTENVDVGLNFSGLQRMYKEHDDFGGLRVVVQNYGKAPTRIAALTLNGKAVQESYVDFVKSAWDARGVVWYRVRPRLMKPGECGQVYIRFRKRPAGKSANVEILLENGSSTKVSIPFKSPDLQLDFVTTNSTYDTLYVYARKTAAASPGKAANLILDGKPLANAKVYGADFPGGVTLLTAKLAKPLKVGDFHVAQVRTSSGKSVAAQFRVMRFWFPRSSFHVPPEICKAMRMNLAMVHEHDLKTCEKYNIHTTSHSVLDLHKRVAYIYGPDEPDAQDNRGGGYANGLGATGRALTESSWQELLERSPWVASMIVMDGTTRPLNWGVYGQFADITCFDPYPVTYYGGDHSYVAESLDYARLCGTPKPMFACMEAFGWGAGQGVPEGVRGPYPEEYRQNIIQAIGAGMKGLTSWVYAAGAGGWEINPECAAEIAKMNALIESIQNYLLIGTPVDLVECDAATVMTGTYGNEKWPKPKVHVSALICGPDAMVITAANHIPASKTSPVIEPAKGLNITVHLPDYLRNVKPVEVTEGGLAPVPYERKGSTLVLKPEVITTGSVFLLRK